MKCYRPLLLCAFIGICLSAVPVIAQEDASDVAAEDDIQASLETLDSLLISSDDGAVAPDALSGLHKLQADFDKLRTENQSVIRNLEDENEILKAEVDRQHRRAEKAEAERLEIQEGFEQLFNRSEGAGLTQADAKLQSELAAALEDMKAVDSQRRTAMDDLFRQLAARDRELAASAAEAAALQAALADSEEIVQKRDRTLAERHDQIADQEQMLADERKAQDELKQVLDECRQFLADQKVETEELEGRIRSLQQESERIQRVDEQRRKTLDETLAALADSQQKVLTLSTELQQVRTDYEQAVQIHEKTFAELQSSNDVLDHEVQQMERDVAVFVEARDSAQARMQELKDTVADRDRRIVDLEQQVSSLAAVDDQRRKAMDRILLDVATLEQKNEKLQVDFERERTALSVKSDGGVSATADREISRLRTENAAHVLRIEILEKKLRDMPGDTIPESAPVIAVAGSEAARLQEQLQEWRLAAERDAARLEQVSQELEQARQVNRDLTAELDQFEGRRPDIRESDLYKELEQINAMLREKMLEVEGERQQLAMKVEETAGREVQQAQELEGQARGREKAESALAEALAREDEYQELLERLVPQIAELEKQVTALVQERLELTSRLRERDEDLQALKVELERREHRLSKAERVAEVLEKARVEVMQAGDHEKRNMHYNMAAVYAREGKFADAEREYLQALRIDPADADVHYNLGILYDDEMKLPEKAALHYRRYLQLSPHGPDADRVRNWLMKLDMKHSER